VIHKALRRFIEDDDASGLQPAVLIKVQRIVSFLQNMEREEELRTVPSWKAHMLTGTARERGACS
jgi:proteic killer suppression protein